MEGGTILRELYESNKETEAVDTVPTEKQIKEDEAATRSLYLDDVMAVNTEYSKYYGGSYLDDGELVVLLTDTSSAVKSFVKNTIESTPQFEECDVSLQELETTREFIKDFCINYTRGQNIEMDKLIESIVVIGTYVDENIVSVGIKDCDKNQIELFKKYIINSTNVVFENIKHVANTAHLQSGQSVDLSSGNPIGNYVSVGFRCKRMKKDGSYEKGFVTCGHGNDIGWKAYSVTGEKVGEVHARSYEHGTKTDASFVCVEGTNYEGVNTMLFSGRSYSTSTNSVAKLDMLYMEGRTSGCVAGTVKATSVSMHYGGVTTDDLYQVSYESAAGDSGGIVYKKSGSNYLVVGIHKGHTTDVDGKSYSYTVKVKNITSSLSVSIY